MTIQKPLPVPNADNKIFWDACKRHELVFPRCRECGNQFWPAAFICPACHADQLEWVPVSGKGRVYSFVVYHQAFHPGFESDLPYVAAVIQLEEGPRFLSNVINCPVDQVHCEMPVSVVWDDIDPQVSLPKFQPAA